MSPLSMLSDTSAPPYLNADLLFAQVSVAPLLAAGQGLAPAFYTHWRAPTILRCVLQYLPSLSPFHGSLVVVHQPLKCNVGQMLS